jgi:hypothetical protein
MMDANSDGLPDVVKDDKVWFNRKNGMFRRWLQPVT